MQTLHDFSDTLNAARLGKGLSNESLALSCGLSPLAVRQAMQGKTAPRITTVFALAKAVGLELLLVPQEQVAMATSILKSPGGSQKAVNTVTTMIAGLNRP